MYETPQKQNESSSESAINSTEPKEKSNLDKSEKSPSLSISTFGRSSTSSPPSGPSLSPNESEHSSSSSPSQYDTVSQNDESNSDSEYSISSTPLSFNDSTFSSSSSSSPLPNDALDVSGVELLTSLPPEPLQPTERPVQDIPAPIEYQLATGYLPLYAPDYSIFKVKIGKKVKVKDMDGLTTNKEIAEKQAAQMASNGPLSRFKVPIVYVFGFKFEDWDSVKAQNFNPNFISKDTELRVSNITISSKVYDTKTQTYVKKLRTQRNSVTEKRLVEPVAIENPDRRQQTSITQGRIKFISSFSQKASELYNILTNSDTANNFNSNYAMLTQKDMNLNENRLNALHNKVAFSQHFNTIITKLHSDLMSSSYVSVITEIMKFFPEKICGSALYQSDKLRLLYSYIRDKLPEGYTDLKITLAKEIINEEKYGQPSRTISRNFFKNVLTNLTRGDRGTNNLQTLINRLSSPNFSFAGFDLYLLKNFLMACKRVCQHSSIPFPDTMNTKLTELQNGEMFTLGQVNKLGSGKYNTVYAMHVFHNNQEKTQVWKTVATNLPEASESLFATSSLSGIPRQTSKAKLIERSLLTEKCAELLFPGKKLVAKTVAATVSPQDSQLTSGIIMERVAGKPIALKEVIFNLSKNLDKTQKRKNIEQYIKLRKYTPDLINIPYDNFITLAKHDLPTLTSYCDDAYIEKSDSKLIIKDKRMKFNNVDALTKALENSIRLGILDYLTGQTDRHYENYYVTPEGDIVAIDNDMSFGTNVGARGQGKGRGIVPNNASLLVNLPKIITNDIRNDLFHFFYMGGYNELLTDLKYTFGNDSQEVEGFIKRANEVMDRLLFQNTPFVYSAQELVNKENIWLLDSETNYLVRDYLVRRDQTDIIFGKSGWNPYRANRKAIGLTQESMFKMVLRREEVQTLLDNNAVESEAQRQALELRLRAAGVGLRHIE